MAKESKLIFRGVDKVSKPLDKINKKLGKMSKKLKNGALNSATLAVKQLALKAATNALRIAMVGFVAALAGAAFLLKKSVSDFAAFEKGLFGIRKTTGLSGNALKKFGNEVQNISRRLPVSQSKLLAYAQSAGQLGVENKNLLKFTETMGKLELASDVAGEEGAKSIARILTVTKESTGDVDRFGAALVDLGNKSAAAESEILRATNEIARGTAQFDVNSAQALGFGAALRTLGIQAEAGGTVVTKTFIAIDKALIKGGAAAKFFAAKTGDSVESLRTQFAEDAPAVFQKFLKVLAEARKVKKTQAVLKGFGVTGDRVNKVLIPLALRNEILAKSITRSTEAWRKNVALNEEVAVQNQSLDASFQRLSNTFTVLRTNLGEKLAPAVAKAVEKITEFTNSITDAEMQAVADAVVRVANGVVSVGKWAGWAATKFGALADAATRAVIAVSPLRFFTGGKSLSELAAGDTKEGETGPIGAGGVTQQISDIQKFKDKRAQTDKIKRSKDGSANGVIKIDVKNNANADVTVESEVENANLERGKVGSG